jgi:hypothetical protein
MKAALKVVGRPTDTKLAIIAAQACRREIVTVVIPFLTVGVR